LPGFDSWGWLYRVVSRLFRLATPFPDANRGRVFLLFIERDIEWAI
jgi:hypothetical protein